MSPLPAFVALLLAQAPPVFRVDVEAVYVDVYVTHKGAPVTVKVLNVEPERQRIGLALVGAAPGESSQPEEEA